MPITQVLKNSSSSHFERFLYQVFFLFNVLIAIFCFTPNTMAQSPAESRLPRYLQKLTPTDIFAGADTFGAPQGSPPIVPVLKQGNLLGYAFLTTDFTRSIGYSGKPIHVVVGLSSDGTIQSATLVEHAEPIVLAGIPEKAVIEAINSLLGKNMTNAAKGAERPPQIDIVSGATVTMLVIGDSVARASTILLRSGRIGSLSMTAHVAPTVKYSLDTTLNEQLDWATLVGDGSIRHLHLAVGEVSKAFKEIGQNIAAERPEKKDPEETFIDLYVTLVTVPSIGRSVLGEDGYKRMLERLEPGQQAILVAGEGAYSFKGSGYVRGGIFDRIELQQDGETIRFHDYNHTRIPTISGDDAPRFLEIALFTIPNQSDFNPTEPWDLQLLVQRAVGARDKAFLPFGLNYSLPGKYLKEEKIAPTAQAALVPEQKSQPSVSSSVSPPVSDFMEEEAWVRIWQLNKVKTGVTLAAIGLLTGLFFFQNQIVANRRVFKYIRRGFLAFTIIWLGFILRAQLSIVNVLAYFNALLHDFQWEYFLMEPQIFVLWLAVAAALLFWGRGPFCGWLCPVGAVQEFVSIAAKALKIPQIKVPWSLHERLWPIKYIIFLGLFGLSMYSLAAAEIYAEVEPFKTFFLLRFAREWPYVVYALTLLSVGLVIERFFCRYICPLGAALAIPGRLRMFDWLKRYKECGSPCALCANECPVQAIHPDGQINVNECIYCMNCQELYWDETHCPHMIAKKVRRDKLEAISALEPVSSTGS